ncbi:putative 3-deoxy-D-manno-octulosonic-acid transferase [delta proteobacterium NaphS2]|nr:putative 3-deoxy-D-manno-octulosonic-acid transferase [delta proteobacterium NaphS2]
MILYHFVWSFLLIFLVPAAFLSGQKRLKERLALNLPKRLPKKDNIWVHALSVGEVLSAVPLVAQLKAVFPDKDIVFSVATRSGVKLANEKLGSRVASIITLPLDAWWCVRRVTNRVRPSIFILVETDLWPGLLSFLEQKGVKSLLVNGRISPRTSNAYLKAPALVRRMFAPLRHCLMQTPLDRDRLVRLGMDGEKVITTGNIKFDRETGTRDPERKAAWIEKLGLNEYTPIWLAGSTHDGEEAVILKVFQELKREYPLLRLIIAPRDVGRSREISRLVSNRDLAVALRTRVSEQRSPYDVLVLDTVGELGQLYDIGCVAFVGGSLVPIGGHNLLEPADSGIPVIFGPHTHNFELMSELILKAGGALRVQNGAALFDAMKDLLSSPGLRNRMGEKAKSFVSENRGALKRVMTYVVQNMKSG